MDCYGVGSILYEVLIDDINGFPTLPLELSPIVIGLLATEPEHRLTVPQAMLALARKISADRRPWPKWGRPSPADAQVAAGASGWAHDEPGSLRNHLSEHRCVADGEHLGRRQEGDRLDGD